jgi:hypothetical protein
MSVKDQKSLESGRGEWDCFLYSLAHMVSGPESMPGIWGKEQSLPLPTHLRLTEATASQSWAAGRPEGHRERAIPQARGCRELEPSESLLRT